jgi:methylglyoxal synthase
MIGTQKHIALVAHDNRKEDLIAWVKKNEPVLKRHFLCGTGTTAKRVAAATGLPVHPYKSGPLGGDVQISAAIAEEQVDFLVFFWDPLTSQPHDPDVKALLRIAVLYNIPVAMNQSTADFLLFSKYMDQEYAHGILDYSSIRKG